MNKYQKVLNNAVKNNIKLFPSFEDGSYYKRRKVFNTAIQMFTKGKLKMSDFE